MSAIAGQTAGPNGLKYFKEPKNSIERKIK